MPVIKVSSMRSQYEDEAGFTLVELLVVILIIGILASIAIPVFLNQRKVANDATVESDVKNGAIALETYFVNNKDTKTINLDEIKKVMAKSPGVYLAFHGDRDDFCIEGKHSNGKKYLTGLVQSENNNMRPYALYNSKDGGLVPVNAYSLTGKSCHFNTQHWF